MGFWSDRMSVLVRGDPRNLSVSVCVHPEERPCENTARSWQSAIQEESSHQKPTVNLDLRLPASRMVKNFFKPPNLWCFVMAAWAKTPPWPFHSKDVCFFSPGQPKNVSDVLFCEQVKEIKDSCSKSSMFPSQGQQMCGLNYTCKILSQQHLGYCLIG